MYFYTKGNLQFTTLIKGWDKICTHNCLSADMIFNHTELMYIRAGEFTKKKLYHGKNRVFGPKNAPKKRGSPTPNFPPPQFGK